MKRLKKLSMLLAALLLVTAGTLPALAASGAGSITVDNAIDGKTYTIYRLLDLSDHNDDFSGVHYQVSAKWAAFFAAGAAGADYVEIDGQGYVTWKSGKSIGDFAAAAAQFAESEGIEHDGQQTAGAAGVTFSSLPLGYYLVQSGLGATCALDTTRPHVTVHEKNSSPSADKQVKEDSTGQWGSRNDGDVGQDVEFRSTLHVTDGAPVNYVFHDEMSDGIAFLPESAAVKCGDRTLTAGTDYDLVTGDLGDTCTFEIHFAQGVLQPNDTVIITYSARITAAALVSGPGTNRSRVTYGESGATTWEKTETCTWTLPIFKYTEKNESEVPLAGAKFVLYKIVGGVKLYAAADGTNCMTGWTENGPVSEPVEGTVYGTVFVTPDSGSIVVSGLDSDTYYLEEIAAPAGYGSLLEPVEVTIDAQGNVTYPGGAGTVRVLNIPGASLPSTGGMGTALFYTVGGLLIAAAAGLLFVLRRRAK